MNSPAPFFYSYKESITMSKFPENSDDMYICSVCNKLLETDYEQWICNFCMSYDSYAYKYARNQENETNYD